MKLFRPTICFFAILLFFGLAKNSFAAPSVSGVSGTVSDGSSITISGSSFGTNANVLGSANVEWLGGSSGPIESMSSGASITTRSRWDGADAGTPMSIATDQSHSGTKSLKGFSDEGNMSGAYWDAPASYHLNNSVGLSGELYATWWVRRLMSGGDGQWKMVRFTKDDTVVDGTSATYFPNWTDDSYVNVNPTGGETHYFNDTNVYPQNDNIWYRVEADLKMNTSVGSGNGTLTVTDHNGTTIDTETLTGMGYLQSGVSWNYVLFQNYIGNGSVRRSGYIWMDDTYIQNGSPARVELCSGSVWASRGHCEIQPASSWSSSSITLPVNRGSFGASDPAYLYVVDSTGANSNGYAVTLGSGGGGGGDTTPPAAPTGLSVS